MKEFDLSDSFIAQLLVQINKFLSRAMIHMYYNAGDGAQE